MGGIALNRKPIGPRKFVRDGPAPPAGSGMLSTGAFVRGKVEADLQEVDKTRVGFKEWSLQIPEPKHGTLNFERFPYLEQLYAEGWAEKEWVIKKATQVGVSTWLWRWTVFWADVKGLTGLYVFPKVAQMYDFSDARIRASILLSPYLMGRIPAASTQNKGLKQVGLGWVYFRGSESKTQLDSVDADVLALDEYDTLTYENIPDAERRIGGSQLPGGGLIRRVGVPSIPGFGIAKLYDESDQRKWLVKCGACNEWQELLFDKCMPKELRDQESLQRLCQKCHKPLDVKRGEWVAKHPDQGRPRGYHLSRLIVPNTDLKAIVKASRSHSLAAIKIHHNKDLGEPWVEESGRLSMAHILAAQSKAGGYTLPEMSELHVGDHGYKGFNLVTMGVDVASSRNLNVRISEHLNDYDKRALFIGEVQGFEELPVLMRRYGVGMAAIDNLPEMRSSRAFAELFPGQVYLISYGNVSDQTIKVNDEMSHATVRRVEAIDAAFDLIRKQRNRLPKNLPPGYTAQMQALVRNVETDPETGRVVINYETVGEDGDDYAHAEVYDLLATELWWLRQELDEAQRDTFTPLETLAPEFQRSNLDEDQLLPGDFEFNSGPGGDADYNPFRGDV